ncbi:MAG: hypothetical protein AAFV47_09185 [Pseudomonadota bacterium]
MPAKKRRTKKNDTLLFEALETGMTIGKAADLAGYARRSIYRWIEDHENNPGFKEEFESAREIGAWCRLDELREESRRRAVDGWDEPVFYEGKQVGAKRKYSDALLIAELKRHDKGYIDRLQVSGDQDQPIQVVINKPGTESTTLAAANDVLSHRSIAPVRR